MMVMMTAITPSLNASRRPLPISEHRTADLEMEKVTMRTSLRNSHSISAHCLAPDDQGWRGVKPHGDGRALIAAAASLVTLFVANTASPASDAFLELVVAVEETKGHLVVSQELYGASQRGRAALHAAHPVQEI